jgi:hypothetical protein
MPIFVYLNDGSYVWSGDPSGPDPDFGPDGRFLYFEPRLDLENSGQVTVQASVTSGEITLKLSTDAEPEWESIEGWTVESGDPLSVDWFAESEGRLSGLLIREVSSPPGEASLSFTAESSSAKSGVSLTSEPVLV